MFDDVAPLEAAEANHISFLDNTKYLTAFSESKAGACFVRPRYAERAPEGMPLLLTEDPYTAYALTAAMFYPPVPVTPGISPLAVIDSTASIGEGCRIDAGAWVGKNAKLGARCHIGANAVIGDGVTLGDDSSVGALSSLSHAVIGHHTVIHRGVHIGQDGFGYAPSAHGIVKVPQLGRVMIGDYVEIGSGTCIDRGAGPDTVIGDHSKIDNLVQIGHNCRIGRFVFITGQVGLAGSTRVDDGAMLGGQSGVSGHVTIGKGAKIAARAGVMTDVPPGATYGGSPAVPIRDWHRQTATVTKLSARGHKQDG